MSLWSIKHLRIETYTKKYGDGSESTVGKFLCGEESNIAFSTDDRENGQVTCRKCSKLIAKQSLRDLAADGTKIEATNLERGEWDVKSRYDLIVNGEFFGHVQIDHGWGKRWEVKNHGDEAVWSGYSMFAGMAAAPRLIEEGELISWADFDKQKITTEQRRAQHLANTKRVVDERNQRLADAQEALSDLRDRMHGTLTNMEVDAIETALDAMRMEKVNL